MELSGVSVTAVSVSVAEPSSKEELSASELSSHVTAEASELSIIFLFFSLSACALHPLSSIAKAAANAMALCFFMGYTSLF